MMGDSPSAGSVLTVPLFPLPNVVLFPRAVLPLHIFEQRYRQMTSDALSGNRQIAMALLKPGWEKSYYERPEIEPVVCIGTILSHEKLPDGKYNFLLQGEMRARIVQEKRCDKSYRIARVERIQERPLEGQQQVDLRQRLEGMLVNPKIKLPACSAQLAQLAGSSLPLADIADLIAYNCIEDVPVKQALLAEADVGIRVARILDELEKAIAETQSVRTATHRAHLN